MRTIEEIEAELASSQMPQDFVPESEDQWYMAGYQAGLKKAIWFISDGYTSRNLIWYARDLEAHYKSVGDSCPDAWQNGVLSGLFWACEFFDYGPDGSAIMRDSVGL